MGKSNVGKSLILLSYINNGFLSMKYPQTTISVDFKQKTEQVNDKIINLQLWDTAGLEQFRPIIQTYYKNAKAAILVFDLNDIQSLIDVKYWLRELRIQCGKDVIKILVGNKCDLEYNEPDQEIIQQYCKEYEMEYIKTSAVMNINIQELFRNLSQKIYEKFKDGINSERKIKLNQEFQQIKNENKKKCC
ncbi:ras oncogene family protein, putative [Ichthyophthirius multifiliis]|uniref:Ras oncogene family protein, putative n=1 Tax=Ichthyophthirius multifiliis TaxID=5932 RepID=G0R112_ICHMU|nr:ras oncogene family protein, putative [Ichthyophthirius multifiliis]EGR28843.1 ras oncogene family protein, putative [Ichthyophthirius multifiliis]|eukprot:XP_004030079.1 ras oncogene family protein, putative [Ichthyophthirius multifiliis]